MNQISSYIILVVIKLTSHSLAIMPIYYNLVAFPLKKSTQSNKDYFSGTELGKFVNVK